MIGWTGPRYNTSSASPVPSVKLGNTWKLNSIDNSASCIADSPATRRSIPCSLRIQIQKKHPVDYPENMDLLSTAVVMEAALCAARSRSVLGISSPGDVTGIPFRGDDDELLPV